GERSGRPPQQRQGGGGGRRAERGDQGGRSGGGRDRGAAPAPANSAMADALRKAGLLGEGGGKRR
ncbi:hypothetical protein, partial [Streptomyces cinereoruber]